jgi:hypothetical protein
VPCWYVLSSVLTKAPGRTPHRGDGVSRRRCAPVPVCGSAKVERVPQIFQTSVVDGGSRDCRLILNELQIFVDLWHTEMLRRNYTATRCESHGGGKQLKPGQFRRSRPGIGRPAVPFSSGSLPASRPSGVTEPHSFGMLLSLFHSSRVVERC